MERKKDDTPRFVGRHQLLEAIGAGAMGSVHRGFDPLLEREVAIKIFDLPAGPAALETVDRFRREAVALARLDHPNLVRVHDVGCEGHLPYLVMNYLEGPPLDEILAAGPLDSGEALRIVRALASGLDQAHRVGLVHRDVKPANVVLCDGQPVLTDFGLAVLAEEAAGLSDGEVAGSPAYMAPEQVEGVAAAIGPWTDVYGLGALLHELLTGRPPVDGFDRRHVYFRILHGEPVDPRAIDRRIDPALAAICSKALARSPGGRYRSMAALIEDLDRFRAGPSGVARLVRRITWRWLARG